MAAAVAAEAAAGGAVAARGLGCSPRVARVRRRGARAGGVRGDAPARRARAARRPATSSDEVKTVEDDVSVESTVAPPVEGATNGAQVDLGSAPAGAGAGLDLLATALLISPFFFWGTSMVAMKGTLEHTTPFFVAASRLLPAGALVVAYALANGIDMPRGAKAWRAIALFSLVDAAAFQGFLAKGLTLTSAGLGSVIIDSQPLTVAVLASLLFGEELGAVGIVGLLIGVAGLLLLEVPDEALRDALSGGGPAALLPSAGAASDVGSAGLLESGEFFMLLAAQSMAVGTVMVRWVGKFADPVMATGWHMVLGSLPLLYLAIAGEGYDAAVAAMEPSDWASLAYTSIFGGAVGYGVFFYNANRGNLTKLSSLTFLTPMFAAGFGYLVLDETLSQTQLLGAAVTLGAVFLVNAGGEDGEDVE